MVRLAVLIDRGHREVPVKPNFVGKHIPSSERERVRVKLRATEQGEKDEAVIYSIINPSESADARSLRAKRCGAIAQRRKDSNAIDESDLGIGRRALF